MSKEHKNICLVTTVYSFFLYLLINGYNKEDIFIFTAWFPREVSKNVKHIQMPPVLFIDGPKMAPINTLKGIFKNIIGYFLYFYGYLKLRLLLFIKTFNKEVSVYGHAQTPFSFIFYENEDSYIIEDGLGNYSPNICETHKINPLIDKFLHLCGMYFINVNEAFGTHKCIKKIYLTRENNNPLIRDKVVVMDIKKMWATLSITQQKEILDIFNVNLDNINFKDKTALILTQPLYEDHFSTLEEEMNVYDEFLEKFKDYSIIIKPHPRDPKDYKNIYPNVEVLDKFFPIELLNLMEIKPTVVCSVISNALLNFEDSEIYVYQGEIKNERLINARRDLLKLLEKNQKMK